LKFFYSNNNVSPTALFSKLIFKSLKYYFDMIKINKIYSLHFVDKVNNIYIYIYILVNEYRLNDV